MNGERTVPTDDDGLLVARFLRGDVSGFDALFLKYQDYVYNIIYGIVGSGEESRDLTQEVFVQVYRSLPRFRQGARFATWLYRIAVNRAVDAARGARRWRFLPILDEPSLSHRAADPETEPESVFARGQEREDVQKVLLRCPLSHRDILVLRYYRGLSLDEIAETLGCTLAAAKVRLYRARHVFKDNYIATHGTEALGICETEETDAEHAR
jgi:RNA polymerase sigma-70 factor (ECF subfamily)